MIHDWKPPEAFRNPRVEGDFKKEYTKEGLSFAQAAFLVAASFAAITFCTNEFEFKSADDRFHPLRQAFRLCAMTTGVLGLFAISRFRDKVESNYPAIVGGFILALILFLCAVVLATPHQSGVGAGRMTASFIIAAWILFCLARLPRRMTMIYCAILVVVLCYSNFRELPLPYWSINIVATTLILGWISANRIERHERILFHKSRVLAALQYKMIRRTESAYDAMAAKSKIMSFVGHEMRNPTLGISWGAYGLRRSIPEPLSKPQEQYLGAIEECVGALNRGIDELSISSRADRIDLMPQGRSIDLYTILLRIERVHAAAASTNRVRLKVVLPEQGDLIVNSDGNLYWKVVSNLVSNAIKYKTNDLDRVPWVLVRARRCPAGIRLTVRDNGIGMSKEFIPRMYEERAREARSDRNVLGSGSGLAIVKMALDRLADHRLKVRSILNVGSTFELFAPEGDLLDTAREEGLAEGQSTMQAEKSDEA